MFVSPSYSSLVLPPATTVRHVCWCYRVPMSLWLSGPPAISFSELQVAVLQGLSFPSNSATFIFFWTFFVTSVIILSLAIRATYWAPRAGSQDPSDWMSKISLHRHRPANWEDEEKAAMMSKDGYATIKI